MKTTRTLLTLGALCALLAPALRAQDALIQPTAISSSTSATDAFPVARLIDGSGLSGAPTLAALGTHDPASGTTAWVTDANTPDYYGALPAPVLTCTLPGLHSVSELVIWGYHFGAANANEGKMFEVAFSTDGVNFAHTVAVTSPVPLASGALRLPLPGPLRVATHVRVTITDNHFGAAPGGDRVGLGELRFAGQPAIVVTNPSDSGLGSLRAAIATAASTPGPDTITFDPGLNGGSIALTTFTADAANGASALVISDTTGGVTVDATSLSSGLTLTDTGTPASGYRCFRVANGSSLALRGLTLSGFTTQTGSVGGGIHNDGTLALTQCTLSGNSASDDGGAIINFPGGVMTLTQCTLSGNSTSNVGGAIYNYAGTVTLTQCSLSGNSASNVSGAIFNSGGTVTLTLCTLSGNSASGDGGAIFNQVTGTVMLTQCSLSGNSASNVGGAIFNGGTGTAVTLTHCTLSGNSASTDGGAIYNYAGTVTLHNTIAAGNTSVSSGPDISTTNGTITANGVNLIGNLADSTLSQGPNVLTGAALLAPLGNYGGPTLTMPPLPGSPAIDAAAVLSPPLTADQRGFPIRDGDGNGITLPDIGAAEANAPIVVTTAVDENDTPPGSSVSLREALALAASAPGPDLITFATGLNGASIALTGVADATYGASALAISDSTGGVTVDATSLSSGLTLTDTGTPASGYRCFRVAAGSSLTLRGLRLSGFTTQTGSNGGAIRNAGTLTLAQCSLSTNVSDYQGGAIFNEGTGTVMLTQCSLTGNSASNAGGAVYNEVTGTLTLTHCTLYGNIANDTGGAIGNVGSLALTRCTLSGNSSNFGGAIINYGSATLTHCTLAGNTAVIQAGGIYNQVTLTLHNTIVAGNASSSGPDIVNPGTITRQGVNIVQFLTNNGTVNGPGSILAVAPQLAPLGNYGGPTQTMPPLPGSPAIDAAALLSPPLTTDQRGFPIRDGDGNGSVLPDIGAAEAQRVVVTTTGDTGTGSLRAALAADASGTTPADIVAFATSGPIVLGSEIVLTAGVALDGGSGGVTIDGGPGTNRIFTVNSGTHVFLRSLTLTGGNGVGTYSNTRGGAIYNKGSLTLEGCTIHGNSTSDIFSSEGGGGIYSDYASALMLNRCTFHGNTAYEAGAVRSVAAVLVATQSTFTGNSAQIGGAFSIANGGAAAALTHCTIAGNQSMRTSTDYGGGGIFLYKKNVTLAGCIIAGNTATNGLGPDVHNNDNGTDTGVITTTGANLIGNLASSTLSAGPNVLVGAPQLAPLGNYGGPTQTMPPLPGSPAIDAAAVLVPPITADQRGFPIRDGDGNGSTLPDIGAAEASIVVTNANDTGPGSLRQALTDAAALPGRDWIVFAPGLSGETITVGSQITIGDAGGVEIDATTLPGGVTVSGGGINRIFWVNVFTSLSLRGLSLTGGNANNGPTNTFGGAILIKDATTVALDRCTLSGNTATDGGAIFNLGTLTLTRCTIANNSVSQYGGGIFQSFLSSGVLTLTQCTIAGNAANICGGVYNGGPITLTDSIIAQNSAVGAPDINIAPSTIRTGVNLIGNLAGSDSSIVPGPTLLVGDPSLAPLANYGGPTMTMPPLPGSRALDAAGPSSFTTDQRGLPRPQDNDGDSIATADIGAVEGVHNPYGPGVLAGMTYLSPGKVRFQFTQFNGPGPFRVFAASEITHPFNTWTYLGLAVESPVGSGEFIFTDPNAASFPRRFYRVVTP
jgi:hypothetical protein